MKIKLSNYFAALAVAIIFALSAAQLDNWESQAKQTMSSDMDFEEDEHPKGLINGRITLQIAGSRLPDCSHACGSCTPCKLVSIASTCALLTEAESCPVSYRCMCKNKTYPVP